MIFKLKPLHVIISIVVLCLVSALLVIILVLYQSDDELIYVFQLHRHGARAPMTK
jgi:hypothetical protein